MSRSSYLGTRFSAQDRSRYSIIQAKHNLDLAISNAASIRDAKGGSAGASIEAALSRVEKTYAEYIDCYHRHQAANFPLDIDMETEYKTLRDRRIHFLHQELPVGADPLEVPQHGPVERQLTGADSKNPIYTDKRGRIRAPSIEDNARNATASIFKMFEHTMRGFARAGEPIDSRTLGSFHREVTRFVTRRKELYSGENPQGVVPDMAATTEGMMSELLVLYRNSTQKLFEDKIYERFGVPVAGGVPRHANMAAPPLGVVGGLDIAAERKIMLPLLGMDPNNLQPELAAFQKALVAVAHDPVKLKEILDHAVNLTAEQREELSNLAKSTRLAEDDVKARENWVDKVNKWLEDKGGVEIRKHSAAYNYMVSHNKIMKQLTPSDRMVIGSTVAGGATWDAFPASGGVADKTTLSQAIHDNFSSAFEKKGSPPDLTPEDKDVADTIKTVAEEGIDEGNRAIEARADILKVAAASSLNICHRVLDIDRIAPKVNQLVIGARADIRTAMGLAAGVHDAISAPTREILREVLTNAANDDAANLASVDHAIVANARLGVSTAGAVANGIAVIAFNKPADFSPQQVNRITVAAAAEAKNGRAAVIRVIRYHVEGIVPQVPAGAERDKKINDLVNDLTEGVDIGFGVAKGEKARRLVHADAETKAAADLKPVMPQQSEAMAMDLARRLSALPTVNEAAVRGQLQHTIGHTNAVLDALTQIHVLFAPNGSLNGVLNGLPLPQQTDLLNRIKVALRSNYLANNLTQDQAIINIITQELNAYTQRIQGVNGAVPLGPVVPQNLVVAAAAIRGFVREVPSNANPQGGLQRYHILMPQEAGKQLIASTGQQAFDVSAKKAEKGAEAGALGAGLESDVAKTVGAKAKASHGSSGAVAAKESVKNIPGSRNSAGAAVIGAILSNGDPEVIKSSVKSNRSNDDMIIQTGIGVAIASALKRANFVLPLTDAEIKTVTTQARDYYRRHGSIDVPGFLALPGVVALAVGRVAGDADHNNKLNTVAETAAADAKVQKGIEFGKEVKAELGKKGADPEMLEVLASVAGGMDINKAAGKEIAFQFAKHFTESNSAPIDRATALEKIDTAVSLVNARARAILLKAHEVGQNVGAGGFNLGVEAINLSRDIRNAYLRNGSIRLDDVGQFVRARAVLANAAAPIAEKIKTFYEQLQESADRAAPAQDNPDQVQLTFLQKSALAETSVSFADKKINPAAAGSRVGSALLRVPASDQAGETNDRINATVVPKLVARGVGQRGGAKVKVSLSEMGNAVGATHVGLRVARTYRDRAGSSLAAAAAAGDAIAGSFAALTAQNGVFAAQILHWETQNPHPQVFGGNGAVQDASDEADLLAESVSFSIGSVEPIGAQSQSMMNAARRAVRKAALKAAADQADPNAVPPVQAPTSISIAKSIGVAGSLAAAAVKAGCTEDEAFELAVAISDPRVIARGPNAVEQELKKYIAAHEPLKKLSTVATQELCDTARQGFFTGFGASAASDPAYPAGHPEQLGDWAANLAMKVAHESGASPDEVKAVGVEVKAAVDSFPLNQRDTAEFAQQIGVIAAQPLILAKRLDAAGSVSATLAFVLDQGDLARQSQSASKASSLSQVKQTERELEARPTDGLSDGAKNLKTGQLNSDLALLEKEEMIRSAHRKKVKDQPKAPEPKSIDTSHHIDVSALAHPEKVMLTLPRNDESGQPETKSLAAWAAEDKGLADCLKELSECVDAKGKNFATADTLILAVKEYNKTHNPKINLDNNEDFKKDGKGGIRVIIREASKSNVKDLLTLWAKQSKKMKNEAVDASTMKFAPH